MGIIETFREGSSPMQPLQAADYLCAMASQWQMRVQRISATQVRVLRGSQVALQLKGTMFTSIDEMPVEVQVFFQGAGHCSVIHIRGADDLQFGLRIGMRTKYTNAVNDFADRIMWGITSAIPMGQQPSGVAQLSATCVRGHGMNGQGSFCSECGSPRS